MAATVIRSCLNQAATAKVDLCRGSLKKVPGASTALELLETEPGANSMAVGTCIKEGYGLQWAVATTSMAGGMFRSWADAAGVGVLNRSQKAAKKAI